MMTAYATAYWATRGNMATKYMAIGSRRRMRLAPGDGSVKKIKGVSFSSLVFTCSVWQCWGKDL